MVFGGVERPREHDWIERVFATPGADAAQKFDIAAVHLRLRCATALGAGRVAGRWRELLQTYGFAGPIWVTEHGYPADPAFQWDPAYRGTDAATGADRPGGAPAPIDPAARRRWAPTRSSSPCATTSSASS